MKFLLQIDSEDREFLLVALREKRRAKLDRLMELKEEAQTISAELRECDAKISRYSAKLMSVPGDAQPESPPPAVAPVTTDGGRAKRGESGKIIAAKLSELNGAGATTWDLVLSTGTKYSTVRRVLLEMQQSELAVEHNGRWHFCHALAAQQDALEELRSRELEEAETSAPKADLSASGDRQADNPLLRVGSPAQAYTNLQDSEQDEKGAIATQVTTAPESATGGSSTG